LPNRGAEEERKRRAERGKGRGGAEEEKVSGD